VLRQHEQRQQSSSIFQDSLTRKNNAPVYRPNSRPSDISFEADIEREAKLRAAHGRRAAQRDAYVAAGSAPQTLPTSFQQARRNPPTTTDQPSFGASLGNRAAAMLDQLSCSTEFPQQTLRSPGRGAPAGRGLSREGASRRGYTGGDEVMSAASQPSAEPALNLTGVGFNPGSSFTSSDAHTGRRPLLRSVQPTALPSSEPLPATHAPAGGAFKMAEPSPCAAQGGGTVTQGPMASGYASTLGNSDGTGPARMQRAREWSSEVEDAYRLQEAGYRDEREALSLGHPALERWPTPIGTIRKLITRESLKRESPSILYFSKKRECEDKDLHRVKLYQYA
jgi:hypothetical protein